MAETSRSQVTITLGRSGPVVTRLGPVLDSSFSDSQSVVGSKRSVRDRLGSNVDQSQLKRQRGDSSRLNLSVGNGVDDMRLGKGDLRFKIMRKTQSNGQQNGVDLREMLSRPAQPSTTGLGTRQRMPEPRDARQSMFEARDARQPMVESRDARQPKVESRDARQLMFESRDAKQPMFESRNARQPMFESRDARQTMSKPKDVRQRMPEPSSGGILGRIPPTRSADALPQMDSLRNSFSPWALDRLRRRSPDGILGTSRGHSPPMNEEKVQRRPLIRTYDEVRTVPYMRNNGLDFSRPMNTASFVTKPSVRPGAEKPVAPLPAPPPSLGGILQKSSYPVEELLTVDGFLHSLGLEKYAICFKAEEVDMNVLRQMGDDDLKELGIPMGPRKKILLTLLSRSKRQV